MLQKKSWTIQHITTNHSNFAKMIYAKPPKNILCWSKILLTLAQRDWTLPQQKPRNLNKLWFYFKGIIAPQASIWLIVQSSPVEGNLWSSYLADGLSSESGTLTSRSVATVLRAHRLNIARKIFILKVVYSILNGKSINNKFN